MVEAVRSYRIVAGRLDLNGVPVSIRQASVFVVIREGDAGPGPTDWEVHATTDAPEAIEMARHDLAMHIVDGTTLRGPAIVRFTDGRRHLFRGDGNLDGFEVDEQPAS